MPRLAPRSLAGRLLLWLLPTLAVAIAALTFLAVRTATSHQRQAEYGRMQQLAATQAARAAGSLDSGQSLSRSLAQAAAGQSGGGRQLSLRLYDRFLVANPAYLSDWATYVP